MGARPTDAETRQALSAVVGRDGITDDEQSLREASVDRFKKYSAVHGIYSGPFPSVIARAHDADEVSAVLAWCNARGVPVVPRTGRTSTEGGLEVVEPGTVVLDGSQMNSILSIDPVNMQATAQCGVPLQTLEDACREQGLTTGHSPQSKPLAQMGGLVATRSIGQLSTLYGGIEDMVTGLEAVFPDGTRSRIKAVPRRAAGPDIRHIVIGNEGALCFITEVTVKLYRFTPETTQFAGFLIDDMRRGLEVIRQIITAGYRPAVCRVYSHEDAAQNFGFADGRCVMVFSGEGATGIVDATVEACRAACREAGAIEVDPALIAGWFEHLNWGEDKIEAERRAMLETRNLGYTTEISANWSDIADICEAALARIRTEFPRAADLTLLGAHSSHSYQTGTNLYFVYNYDINCDPEDEIARYHIPINSIIVEEALGHGGSMVHHHGVGKYRAPWIKREHGSAYWMLSRLKEAFDPHAIMNPGSIFPREEEVAPGAYSETRH